MYKSDLIDLTMTLVIGFCYQWEQHAKQFTNRPQDFDAFCRRTHNVVWSYCIGRKTLDGSCSDHECEVALRVHRLLREHFDDLEAQNRAIAADTSTYA